MSNEHILTSPKDVSTFTLAGNATLTLKSKKTGKHYTIHVDKHWDRAMWFIKVLAGPEEYRYAGVLRYDHEQLVFHTTKKSTWGDEADIVHVLRWFTSQVLQQQRMPDQLEVWHDGSCGKCGRQLTRPDSIEKGIGPHCAKEMGLE